MHNEFNRIGDLAVDKTAKVFKTFAPISNLVAVRVHKKGETGGGIALVDGGVDPGTTPCATVIATGPDCKWLLEGDVVLIAGSVVGAVGIHGGSARTMVIPEENIIGVSLIDGRRKGAEGIHTRKPKQEPDTL